MNLLSTLRDLFRRPAPPSVTVHQQGIQAQVIRRLIRTGWIDARTVLHMGTTDAHKMFTRLRRLGLLYEADDANGHVLVVNASGTGKFRRHRWTRKFPPGWTSPVSGERRSRKRGGL